MDRLMSPLGGPKGSFRSAQHEGSPVSPLGGRLLADAAMPSAELAG